MSLEAYAIYKTYGDVTALHNVDLITRTGNSLPCSARRAAARPPSFGSWPGWNCRTRARSCFPETTSPPSRPTNAR